MIQRSSNGAVLPNTNVVAADAVAALAGVAGGSTNKVMMALHMLHLTTGIPYDALLNPTAIPAAPADPIRVEATEAFMYTVASHPRARSYMKELRLHRFIEIA